MDVNHLTFFMDDFGTRTICKPADSMPMHAHEFSFALGGVIVPNEIIPEIVRSITDFCAKWEVPALHGNKIRAAKGKFGFLKNDQDAKELFLQELEAIITDERVAAHACVICRPGYRDRYLGKHTGVSKWEMSRTAFDISVERAAKYAKTLGRSLSVCYERSGKVEDRLIESYFKRLTTDGTEFNKQTSAKHAPLTPQEIAQTLLAIWPDGKNNPMLQFADLVLHPLAHHSTGLPNRAYEKMKAANQIIDQKSDDETIAVKYFCFDEPYDKWASPDTLKGPEGPLRAVGV